MCIQSSGTLSCLMQPAPVFKDCWVPSPALSGSHKGLSSVGWEGMTLEDFGSVCLCVYAAGLPLSIQRCIAGSACARVRCFCILASMLVFAYDCICALVLWCARPCACVCFLLFSHPGTLYLWKVCQPVSWERAKQDLKAATALELGQRRERKQGRVWEKEIERESGANAEKRRRSAEYVPLNLVPDVCALQILLT